MLEYYYNLTKIDYRSYFQFLTFDLPDAQKKWRKFYKKNIIICILLIIIISIDSNGLNFKNPSYFTLSFVFFLIFTIINVATTKWRTQNKLEKELEEMESNNMFSKRHLTINDKEIKIEDELTSHTYQWKAITKKYENEYHFILLINKSNAILIPKNIFITDIELNQLKTYFSKHLSMDAEIEQD